MYNFALDCGTCSDKGPYRHRNEDVAESRPAEGIFIVSDGLGGAAAGDRAARIATDLIAFALANDLDPAEAVDRMLPESHVRAAIKERLGEQIDGARPSDRLRFGFLMAHFGVLAEASTSGAVGMATATVVAWMQGGVLCIGHVGDCRAYAFSDGILTLLTRDHSLSMALAGRKSLPRGAESSAFLRSRLTQVIGGEVTPTPDVCNWHPEPGSRLLLCSDGVWGSLDEGEITRQVNRHAAAEELARSLVAAAISAGSRDNATALVVRF